LAFVSILFAVFVISIGKFCKKSNEIFRAAPLRYCSAILVTRRAAKDFWRKTSNGGATKYCVKKTSYMARD
jgi:hypothetical protein